MAYRRIQIILIGLFIPVFGFTQGSEYGIILGISGYKGELNPNYLNTNFMRPAIGGVYRYNFDPHFAWKSNIIIGSMGASDAQASDTFMINRNLRFRSELMEFSTQLEFNFFSYRPSQKGQRFTPYIFTGLSVFRFNPQGQYINGDWYDLQPLGTEGQGTTFYPERKKYALTQFSIPMGGGFKISVGMLNIGIEAGIRKTFTDYLDDVSSTYADKKILAAESGPASVYFSDRSLIPGKDVLQGRQRGNSSDTDWYFFSGIVLTVYIGNKGEACLPFISKY